MLLLKDIVKEYQIKDNKPVQALKGVTLAFRDTGFVAILGPSGCGKTTLLNIIGGLDKYTSGDVIINGQSTTGYSDRDWDAYRNREIGIVFQNYNLIPHLTILGNVELAMTLSGVKKKEREDIKTFEDIIKEKGDIPEKREYTISQLRTMMPQATLDLHGKTEAEALELVKTFLSDCRAHKIRKISIITGKGLHSEGGVGVLRDSVSSFLDSAPGISEKGNAPLQYGGSGAFWIILKKES